MLGPGISLAAGSLHSDFRGATAYLEALAALRQRYERELRGAGIDYHLLDTAKPLDFALLGYLSARARRK